MTNKERIAEELAKWGLSIGVYDEDLDQLSAKQIETVLEVAEYGTGDVDFRLNGVETVVEIIYTGDEVDFFMLSQAEYDELFN